jgi:hypothetical protein
MSDKPELVLIEGKDITFEDITGMFRRLTGREPTPEEVEEARQRWAAKRKPS